MSKKICAVHKYVFGDDKKRECFWCDECGEFICGKCKNKMGLRFLAMCIKWLK